MKQFGGSLCSSKARNAQLPADYGGTTGSATAIETGSYDHLKPFFTSPGGYEFHPFGAGVHDEGHISIRAGGQIEPVRSPSDEHERNGNK